MTQEKYDAKKVVVIGGGLSGLATAALCAKQGWKVTLLEKNSTLGGRARVLKEKGFTFDMGPSWYMMPEVFDRFFAIFDKKPLDFYQLVKLNPRYQVIFSDNQKVRLDSDVKQNISWFEKQESGAGEKLRLFLQESKSIYDLVSDELIYLNPTDFKNWIKLKNLRSMSAIFTKINLLQNWNSYLTKYFKSEKLRQILGFPAVFLGGSPFNTPSIYSILAWADFGKGIWYPKGGMGELVKALEKLAKEQGVEILTGHEVTAIEVTKGKLKSVKTLDKDFPAEIVVGAGDIPFIETQLLPKKYRSWDNKYWSKKTLGISALLIYLGINKKIKGLVHHNLYFSKEWKINFKQIFDIKSLPDDPSFYISVRSATDSSIVPKNSEEMMILVPLGSSTKYSKNELNKYSEKIIDKIEDILDIDIKDGITVKKVYTPYDFASDYNAYQGTALGLAHTLKQSLWFRPRNKSKKVKGLYYAGQYTNPGVGVPMALISAQIVGKLIEKDFCVKEKIFEKGSVTYYNSSRFFKGSVKEDVTSLYSYVRVVDDLVDRKIPLVSKMNEIWDETVSVWKGKKGKHIIVNSFVELAKRKKFKWEWIEAFWDAMRGDLEKKYYKNFDDLESYMYGSAEVIGMMMARIMDLPKKAMKTASLQGKAMQLLNFIRDVEEDEELGRNYLGYSPEVKNNHQQWKEFLRSMIEKYWELQKEAKKGFKYIPRNYLIPIKTAVAMYTWTAKQIYKNPTIVWRKKVKPSKMQVVLQATKYSIFPK